jgi:two-component system, OmpR family, aerobic respiration control sensor histidine kinase ArcB
MRDLEDIMWCQSSDALILLGPKGTVLKSNRFADTLFSVSISGTDFINFCSNQLSSSILTSCSEALILNENEWRISVNGKDRVFLVEMHELNSENEARYLLILKDISYQLLLKKNDYEVNYLREAINLMPFSVFWKDEKSIFVGCNEEFAKAAKLDSPKDVAGLSDYDLPWSKEESDKYRRDDYDVMKTSKPKLNIQELQTISGAGHINQTSKVPVTDQYGKVCGVLGICADITSVHDQYAHSSKKKFDMLSSASTNLNEISLGKLLKTSQLELDFLREIINQVPYYLFWKDSNSVFLGCNKLFSETAGLSSPEDIIGLTDYDLPWSKEDSDAYREDDAEVMRKASPKLNIEEGQEVEGKQHTLLTSKVPIKNATGDVQGILGIYTDITKLKDLESDLRDAKLKAEQANRAKSNFLAVVSHEFRTPLNAVMGISQILLERFPYDEIKSYVEDIESATVDLSTLVDDILEFIQFEQDTFKLRNKEFSLHRMLSTVIKHTQKHIALTPLEFVYFADENIPNGVIGDPLRLQQVLGNLLVNAIKFTNQGKISLNINLIDKTKDSVTLNFQVCDTGIGIENEDIEKITDSFYQVESSFSRSKKGVGLGLSICSQILTALNTKIKISSKLDKGSVFEFDIDFQLTLNEIAPKSTRTLRMQRKKIDARALVVEDNLLNQKVSHAFLQEFGCQVDIASCGEEALNKVATKQYDIIFMDIGLPDHDGLTVSSMIRELPNYKDTPIVALTAHALAHEVEHFLSTHMNDVIIKPIQIDALYRCLVTLLEPSMI